MGIPCKRYKKKMDLEGGDKKEGTRGIPKTKSCLLKKRGNKVMLPYSYRDNFLRSNNSQGHTQRIGINPTHNIHILFGNGMPVPFVNEMFDLARDGVEFEVDKIPGLYPQPSPEASVITFIFARVSDLTLAPGVPPSRVRPLEISLRGKLIFAGGLLCRIIFSLLFLLLSPGR
ncbi:hypothetical protein LguiA_012347 [Lonicera macranthoides]